MRLQCMLYRSIVYACIATSAEARCLTTCLRHAVSRCFRCARRGWEDGFLHQPPHQVTDRFVPPCGAPSHLSSASHCSLTLPSTTLTATVEWYAKEIKLEYDTVDIDMGKGEHKRAPFTDVNPFGKLPAVKTEDGTPIFESGAILLYLADKCGYPPLSHPSGRAFIFLDGRSAAVAQRLEGMRLCGGKNTGASCAPLARLLRLCYTLTRPRMLQCGSPQCRSTASSSVLL